MSFNLNKEPLVLSDSDFIARYVQNAPQIMWFLGAGTSRTAGMPTATDIIWDLKREKHDINNDTIKRKIQSYMDSKGFPALWSAEEYSFYFDLRFGTDYAEQQKYLNAQLSTDKVSLNIGHRALVALLEMKKAKLIFTTNFDSVIERAYAEVTEKDLSAYHLEGSYAALESLNSENFPIYAKIHGDFRYQSIKNLAADLISNDEKIQSCFLAAATRYGLVVSGYSGRDQNVMAMFDKALEQNNPFPQGLYWTVTKSTDIADTVKSLVEKARSKNVKAYIIVAGTFNILLSKIWRQIPNKPDALDKKVRTAIAKAVFIPLLQQGNSFPILRTNALLITQTPNKCAVIDTAKNITFSELNDALQDHKENVVAVKTDKVLAWGDKGIMSTALLKFSPRDPESYDINDPVIAVRDSTIIKSFFEEALAHALINGKPLHLRRNKRKFYAVVDPRQVNNPIFGDLKHAVRYKDQQGNEKPGYICGSFSPNIFWSESVSIRLEEKNGQLWLLLRPDIWLKPLAERQNFRDDIKAKKRFRYNPRAYDLLNAWITILLGETGGNDVTVEYLTNTEFPVKFMLNSRSAFSRKEGRNA
jgi:hypothetical protein